MLTKIQEISQESYVQQAVLSPQKFKQEIGNFGQWTDKQVLKYFLFIYHHRQKFVTKSMRKSLKVFKQMSKFIKSRNSSQCRTHHQNLINKTKTVENALSGFIDSYPQFYEKYQAIEPSLRILDDLQFCQDTSTVIREAKQQIAVENDNSSTQVGVKIVQNQQMIIFPVVLNQILPEISEKDQRLQKLLQFQYLFSLWAYKVSNLTQNCLY